MSEPWDTSKVNYDAIVAARQKIAGIVSSTPTLPSVFFGKQHQLNLILKLENLNLTGSFKIRGAANAMLNLGPDVKTRGVVAASAGNHAQGVAYVAQQLGVKATIFMPERTALIKAEATKSLGAKVILDGAIYDDAYANALKFAKESGAYIVHPYADPFVVCGQGTIGLELLEQVPDLAYVVIPIGGGGLVSGVACALKSKNPKVRIIGVQAAAYAGMKHRFYGESYENPNAIRSIADGIAVKSVHPSNLELIQKYVDAIVTVDEDQIASAVMELSERNHLLVEGAGAAAIAALEQVQAQLSDKQKKLPGVAVISGGNIDLNLLRRIMDRGMIKSGRLMRLRFTIKDKPGELAALLKIVSKSNANLSEVHHDRRFSSAHYADVEVEAVLETTSHEHQDMVLQVLRDEKIHFFRY